uniref:Uncharacterized protein n=1 Tax=Moniliophthora roreri TaxID=221103 RepID=A0A0W0FD41_MONRR
MQVFLSASAEENTAVREYGAPALNASLSPLPPLSSTTIRHRLREGWKEEGEGGRTVLAQDSPDPSPSSTLRTLLNAADETPKKLPLHATPLLPKSTLTVLTNSPETTRKLPWGLSGSLNTATTSPKTRDVLFTSISTPAPPSPRTPASGLHIQHPNTPDSDSANTVVWSFDGLSPPSPPPSMNTYNDEFIVVVVPEAIEASLDVNFAAVGISCKVERIRARWRYRAATPTPPSCSETSTTPELRFWGLSAPALSSSVCDYV